MKGPFVQMNARAAVFVFHNRRLQMMLQQRTVLHGMLRNMSVASATLVTADQIVHKKNVPLGAMSWGAMEMFKAVIALDVVNATTELAYVTATRDTLEIDASTKLSLAKKIVLL